MKYWLEQVKEVMHGQELMYILGLEGLRSLSVLAVAFCIAKLVNHYFLFQSVQAEAVSWWMILLFAVLSGIGFTLVVDKQIARLNQRLKLSVRKQLHHRWGSAENRLNGKRDNLSLLCCETADATDPFFQSVMPVAILGLVRTPLLLCWFFYWDLISGVIFFITLPVVPFILYLLGKRTKAASAREWQQMHKLNRSFRQLLLGMVSLKIFGRARAAIEGLQLMSRQLSESSLRVLRVAFLSAFATELLSTLSIAMAAVFIGLRILYGQLDFFSGFMILLLAPEYYLPLRLSGLVFHQLIQVREGAEKLSPYMAAGKQRPEIQNAVDMKDDFILQVRNVSYTYPGQGLPILKDVSFSVQSGQLTVLTGASGAGKTTMLKLLANLVQPDAGEIIYNPAKSGTMAEAEGKIIGYVPQEPYTFRRSLRENLTLLDNSWSDQELIAALERVGLGGWYRSLPQGLATVLGEGGQGLSNGQRHRLGLARSLLRKPELLFLDELTAGMEMQEERDIILLLFEYLKERTADKRAVVLVSHRQQVLASADQVIVLGQ